MRTLLERRDGLAVRDTLLWLALLLLSGDVTFLLWGSRLALSPYAIYSVLYASTSDSRWHESGQGTAYKDWMNNALYELSSFMVMRNPPSGDGATIVTTATPSSSAVIRRSQCRALMFWITA